MYIFCRILKWDMVQFQSGSHAALSGGALAVCYFTNVALLPVQHSQQPARRKLLIILYTLYIEEIFGWICTKSMNGVAITHFIYVKVITKKN